MPLSPGPHQQQPIREAGAPLARAGAALVMVHGRGATAASILEPGEGLPQPDVADLPPQPASGTWYPLSFLAPIEQTEPYLTSALRAVGDALARAAAAGVPPERTALLGFSQGACLALEFAARNA